MIKKNSRQRGKEHRFFSVCEMMEIAMELRQLKYFIAVAEELNFTRAAERCHIAQPPLSQQIKKLEEELGVLLFHRTNRIVTLTEEGKSFLTVARESLRNLEEGVKTVRSIARGETGRLRVGYLNSAIQTRFPEALTAFRKQHPGITLEMKENESRNQKEALRAGSLDVGLCHHNASDARTLNSRIFLVDTYYLAVHETHPLAVRKSVGWRDLDNELFIMFSRENYPNAYERTLTRFRTLDIRPKIIQDANTHQAKLSLIAAGMGMGFIPERMKQVRPACVTFLPFDWDGNEQHSSIKIAWKKGEISTPLRYFLTIIADFCDTSAKPLNECWNFTREQAVPCLPEKSNPVELPDFLRPGE